MGRGLGQGEEVQEKRVDRARCLQLHPEALLDWTESLCQIAVRPPSAATVAPVT
jgi:hypothetical protein